MPLPGAVLLDPPKHLFSCPNCPKEHVVTGGFPAVPVMHRCAGLRSGLRAPMIPAGTRAKVTAREREDYIGGEIVQMHAGRPVMAVEVERDGGTDAVVFAPTARVHTER